ncbi:Small heat shock protein IbpA [Alphaproteobacteria bacterium SO-S41]|nr:Small heat shock protein IbpA [Alphaproteobacteria bacterium SO-S41]
MRFDLSPLYRSTVGFDRLFQLLDNNGSDASQSYPPYNIERLGETDYRITMAVAGFAETDLTIEVKESALTVAGKRGEDEKRAYLHQGIAARTFERRFQLADHVEVTGAKLENGLLHIELKRVIPESKKPRRIAVTAANAQAIEAKAA